MCSTTGSAMLTFFFFNDTATTEIYTLSLHDALPICGFFYAVAFAVLVLTLTLALSLGADAAGAGIAGAGIAAPADRKSTRLNSSHQIISYAVFCLKKKNLQPVPFQTTQHCNPVSLEE